MKVGGKDFRSFALQRLMKRIPYGAVGVTLSALGAALSPLFGGVGAILMFHRVLSEPSSVPFGPSRDITISLDTFRRVIAFLRRTGRDIVTLDEALRRLQSGTKGKPFVCLTFDDGYRDNYALVYPVCQELDVPITIYITTDMIEERLLLWAYGLSAVVAQTDMVRCPVKGVLQSFPAAGEKQKRAAYNFLNAALRGAGPAERSRMIKVLESSYSVDFASLSKGQAMTWGMIEELAQSGLVEIGAHTVSHPSLSALSASSARKEIEMGRSILQSRLTQPIKHFAYPFGKVSDAGEREFTLCQELGFASAMTTEFGCLFPRHRDTLHNLPRIAVIEDPRIASYTLTRLSAHLSGVTEILKSALRRS